jgi:hypothetical protein
MGNPSFPTEYKRSPLLVRNNRSRKMVAPVVGSCIAFRSTVGGTYPTIGILIESAGGGTIGFVIGALGAGACCVCGGAIGFKGNPRAGGATTPGRFLIGPGIPFSVLSVEFR